MWPLFSNFYVFQSNLLLILCDRPLPLADGLASPFQGPRWRKSFQARCHLVPHTSIAQNMFSVSSTHRYDAFPTLSIYHAQWPFGSLKCARKINSNSSFALSQFL